MGKASRTKANRKAQLHRNSVELDASEAPSKGPLFNFSDIVSLVLALVLAAVQLEGVTKSLPLAIICWIGAFALLTLIIWRQASWTKFQRLSATSLMVAVIAWSSYESIARGDLMSPRPEIFFFEKARIPGTRIPFVDISQFGEKFSEIMSQTPPWVVPTIVVDGRIRLNVILRNPTRVPMRNVSIHMISNVPIRPETTGGGVFSPTEVSYDVRVARPYSQLGEEYFQTISFEAPRQGEIVNFLVTVQSDNSEPYTFDRAFRFVQIPGTVSTN